MNDFEYGLPVSCLIELTEDLNLALDFRKVDVTLDSLNLKPSLENNKLVEKIKCELENSLPYGQLKSNKSPIYFDLNYPDDCLGIVSFNSRNYIDLDLLHEYFEKMDLLKEDAPKVYYSKLINQWISDAEIIENEVQLLLRQITKKNLNQEHSSFNHILN